MATKRRRNNTEVLARVRRKKRNRTVRWMLVVILVLTAIMVYTTGVYSASLVVLGELFDTVRIAVSDQGSFPVQTGIREVYQAEELNGGFVALGEEECIVVSASGGILRTIQAGYARPTIAVGDSRFCLYNRSGKELRIESRSQTLYTKTLANNILLCAMGGNGTLAVATNSDRFLAAITVYSPSLETEKFIWEMTNQVGSPVCMQFSGDSRRLVVGTVTASGGELQGQVYMLNTGADEAVWSVLEKGELPVAVLWLDSSRVLVLFSDFACVYNASNGAELARCDYGGQALTDYAVNGQKIALLFSDNTSSRAVVLNALLEEVGQADLPLCTSLELDGRAFYVTTGFQVQQYGLDGAYQSSADMEARPQRVLAAKKLLVFAGNAALVPEFSAAE